MNTSPPSATQRLADGRGFEISAVQRGLVSTAMVDECRALHSKLAEIGLPMTLGEIYAKKGYLEPSQVAAIESELVDINASAIPGYQILEKLAEGGMGAVYKARQISMDRVVAIKILLPKFSDDAEGPERFLREARAVAKLSHANVVAGIDVGEIGGVYYFVMEFLDGESMDRTLRLCGRLAWREATKIVREIALALEHAHQFKLIHRDIKPSNIMLLKNGTAKLADLGLARSPSAVDTALTQSGMIVGTPAYLSPEQATADREIDIRSDIYSLGLTFFEFISGERAHPGSSPMSILTALLTREIALDKLASQDVPGELIAVVGKMARREPDLRYQSPRELIDDLDAILSPSGAAVSALRQPALLIPAPKPRPIARAARIGALASVLLAAVVLVWWRWPEPTTSGMLISATLPGIATSSSAIDDNTPSIPLLDALAIAQQRVPDGKPYHAELEGQRYSIDFALKQRTYNVEMNALTGEVTHTADEDEDHSQEVEICQTSLADAIRAAIAVAPGRPIEAEIVLRPGRAFVEVRVRGEHGDVSLVAVDGDTGEARVEPKTSP